MDHASYAANAARSLPRDGHGIRPAPRQSASLPWDDSGVRSTSDQHNVRSASDQHIVRPTSGQLTCLPGDGRELKSASDQPSMQPVSLPEDDRGVRPSSHQPASLPGARGVRHASDQPASLPGDGRGVRSASNHSSSLPGDGCGVQPSYGQPASLPAEFCRSAIVPQEGQHAASALPRDPQPSQRDGQHSWPASQSPPLDVWPCPASSQSANEVRNVWTRQPVRQDVRINLSPDLLPGMVPGMVPGVAPGAVPGTVPEAVSGAGIVPGAVPEMVSEAVPVEAPGAVPQPGDSDWPRAAPEPGPSLSPESLPTEGPFSESPSVGPGSDERPSSKCTSRGDSRTDLSEATVESWKLQSCVGHDPDSGSPSMGSSNARSASTIDSAHSGIDRDGCRVDDASVGKQGYGPIGERESVSSSDTIKSPGPEQIIDVNGEADSASDVETTTAVVKCEQQQEWQRSTESKSARPTHRQTRSDGMTQTPSQRPSHIRCPSHGRAAPASRHGVGSSGRSPVVPGVERRGWQSARRGWSPKVASAPDRRLGPRSDPRPGHSPLSGTSPGSSSGSVSGSEGLSGDKCCQCRPSRCSVGHVFAYFRRAWIGVRFKDSDLDEFEPNALRYKPDHIETLCKSTKFSKKEIQLMYRGFKQECPSGTVNEETFKYIYSRFFPQGDSNAYAHHIFNTFDTDHTGTINFEEFVTALSALSRGDIYDKLRWAFSLYDVNGDGYITKEEMLDVVGSVYMLVGRHSSSIAEDAATKQHVDRIFQKMDINGDGVVTMEEFVELCSNDETIAASLNLLDTCF